MTFELGETEAAGEFLKNNPTFWPAFADLLELTNKCFGREYRFRNRTDDICFNLGETCRQDFLEIVFLAVNGYGTGAQKLLRGLFERAVAIEYIRRTEGKAERFLRFAAIQEHKSLVAALGLVSEEDWDSVMPAENSAAKIRERYQEFKPEFQISDCKKCGTTRTAISWDIDVASMVKKLGGIYGQLYLGSYGIANLHVHATLASAYRDEAVSETPAERNLRDANFALLNAMLAFIAVIWSQNELFGLGLQSELESCKQQIERIWQD